MIALSSTGGSDDGDDLLSRGLARLNKRGRKVDEIDRRRLDRVFPTALAGEDAREDERDPLLIGTLAWQRREQYRARRDKREYTVEGAIRRAYRQLDEQEARLRQLHSRQQDALGLQYAPHVVSIADMEAALTFVPNDRGHNKARWVYCLVIGREPTVDGYREAEPRSIHAAAAFLGISRRDAEDGFGYAQATIVTFLCHEGFI